MNLSERWRNIDASWKFALGAYLFVRIFFTAWSLVIATLFPIMLQNLDLFGVPAIAVFDLTTSERYAYSREVDGRALTFRLSGQGRLVDTQTESVWRLADGSAIAGQYAGQVLRASAYSADEIFPYYGVAAEKNSLLALWQRFDANWYLAIAERGYCTIPGDIHFPPLYPALIRLVASLIGNYFVAGMILSNGALVLALALLYKIARDLTDDSTASRTLVFLLLFPTVFFCMSAYTEPIFLLVALLSLRAIQQSKWAWSGFWIFCAILIRLQGVALVVPLAYAMWLAPRDSKIVRLASLGLAGFGGVFYLLLRFVVGDPSIVPMSETTLHARLVFPWENLLYAIQTLASGKFNLADALNLVITTLCILVLMVGWRTLPMIFNLYMLASLIVLTIRLVDTQPLNSMSRYAFTLFPMFIVLAIWAKNAWVQRAVVYLSFLLALYLSAQFFLWGWVA